MDKNINLYKKIPEFNGFDWDEVKEVKIDKSKEQLISLNLIPEKIIVRSQYFIQNIKGAMPECYIRESVYDKLLEAADYLPTGFKFLVYDAWRPKSVQYELYNRLKEEIKEDNQDLNERELNKLVQEYVALPSDDNKGPSPHLTGGAIDLTIIDQNGKQLDMGTAFDETDQKTHTFYYEKMLSKKELSEVEDKILKNRRMLYNIMTEVGFVNYPHEWWHFDYGDQVWAYVLGKDNAFYSISSPDLRWTKSF
ncbi:MAG: M15 family metallopeptidase [Halanaerobiales bacterium]|nr:M15 family metallopeptidase [Halanaerobiales bacterium]